MQNLPTHTAKTELQLLVRGLVYAPGDASYESEAAAFNLATRHTPDLVPAAVNADDVVAAVKWASAPQHVHFRPVHGPRRRERHH
ncbi:hypothetical protein [Arthrobacter sp. RT-1]|uniref:hypothetical protein n=1 Tax=Arthrobacter sp. RT-1 TaxID=2292263 RepID=UPI0021619D01|nr:hypothetical protein [Arthrobacter sp. RT-1]